MLKFLNDLIKKNILFKNYNRIKEIYCFFKKYLEKNYDFDKDLNYNENILISLGANLKFVKQELKKNKIDYYDKYVSWHYHVFTSLINILKNKNILEIGTNTGKFANFLSQIYPGSIITTIDLPKNDNQFLNTYNRETADKLKKFLDNRNKNLNKSNIYFYELNSNYIKEFFKNKKFDLIWIDGDHLEPQVSRDIHNSLDLINDGGIICVDDIVKKENYKDSYVSNESYITLQNLEKKFILKNYYIIKKLNRNNNNLTKYISISFKKIKKYD